MLFTAAEQGDLKAQTDNWDCGAIFILKGHIRRHPVQDSGVKPGRCQRQLPLEQCRSQMPTPQGALGQAEPGPQPPAGLKQKWGRQQHLPLPYL